MLFMSIYIYLKLYKIEIFESWISIIIFECKHMFDSYFFMIIKNNKLIIIIKLNINNFYNFIINNCYLSCTQFYN